METRRAALSVDVLTYGYSPLFVTAALSIFLLLGAIAWQLEGGRAVKNAPVAVAQAATSIALASDATTTTADAPAAAGSTMPLGDAVINSLASKYVSLQNQGLYTPEVGQAVATNMAQALVVPLDYPTYTSADITVDKDTSYDRMLAYRTDLKTSLAPLLKIDQPEFEIFALYVDTKDDSYLRKLNNVAQYYRDAVALTRSVKVPADAVPYHVAILNAMSEFAATLDQMATNAQDPFAAVASLRTYNQAESDMLTSFKALTTYERSKLP